MSVIISNRGKPGRLNRTVRKIYEESARYLFFILLKMRMMITDGTHRTHVTLEQCRRRCYYPPSTWTGGDTAFIRTRTHFLSFLYFSPARLVLFAASSIIFLLSRIHFRQCKKNRGANHTHTHTHTYAGTRGWRESVTRARILTARLLSLRSCLPL